MVSCYKAKGEGRGWGAGIGVDGGKIDLPVAELNFDICLLLKQLSRFEADFGELPLLRRYRDFTLFWSRRRKSNLLFHIIYMIFSP